MGKHGNQDNGRQEVDKDYQPRHGGGQDAFDWAKANEDTVELPKVKKSNERW